MLLWLQTPKRLDCVRAAELLSGCGISIKRLGAVEVLWGGESVVVGGVGGGGNTSQSCPGAAAERRLPSVVWMGPVRVFGCV